MVGGAPGQSQARAVEAAVGDDGAVVGAHRVAIVRVQILDVLRASASPRDSRYGYSASMCAA